ncbi:MAG: hypothetical protein JKX72_03370 [Robiginitomaculum sp.]|nr:hypothetical protein [Robiginitomaculum sp.]
MLRNKNTLILDLGMQGQAVLYNLINTNEKYNIVVVFDGQAESKQFVDSFNLEHVSFRQANVATDGQLRSLISNVE